MTDKLLIDRAVVEQALEALQYAYENLPLIHAGEIDEKLEALREALEQPVAQSANTVGDVLQEPVAYVCPSSHVTADGSMEDGPDYLEWADEASDYEKRVGTPLYTAPQPAKRVLTDEEIDALPWEPSYGNPMTLNDGLREFARAVIAAYKAKQEKT